MRVKEIVKELPIEVTSDGDEVFVVDSVPVSQQEDEAKTVPEGVS